MVNKSTQAMLNSFVDDLRRTHGENLYAVVLYGGAIVGDEELRPDLNLLVALRRITPDDLRLSQAPTREWQRLGHALPTYFTAEELHDAADVFPIEFHRMERSRRLLYGTDPFETLQISPANLRHQTEYELRSKLLQLRRLYIPASVSVEKLCDLMSGSLSSFAALYTSVLLLKGIEPPVAKRDVIRVVTDMVAGTREPYERIFEACAPGSDVLTERTANELFGRYMMEVERVINVVNQLPGHVV